MTTANFYQHSDGTVTYTVQPGDTVASVALTAFQYGHGRYPELPELARAVKQISGDNHLDGNLRPGQVLSWHKTLS